MDENKIKVSYTDGNADDLHAAIDALNTFTKNWCMDCKATEELDEPMFRCKECNFCDHGFCLIKNFAHDRDPDYMREVDFGSMGML